VIIKTSKLRDKVNDSSILRILLIVVTAMVIYTLFLQPVQAKADDSEESGPITLSARDALENALEKSVDAYSDLWQTSARPCTTAIRKHWILSSRLR
jgi:hypothetical protein